MSEQNNTDLSTAEGQASTETQPEDKELLSWDTIPARNRPIAASIVGVFVLVLAYLVYLWTASWFFVAISILVLWGSLSQFYVRTRFIFTERKVKVRYIINKVEKEWAQYRSYYVDKNGVLLSPFLRPSRLENFRGIYIRFSNNRDDVMEIVRQKIQVPDDDVD